MRFAHQVALLVLAAGLGACGEEDLQSRYLPTRVGNRWVYQQLGDGTDVTVTKEITASEELAGQSTYVELTTQSDTDIQKRSNWLVQRGRVLRVRQQRVRATTLLDYRDYDPGFLRMDDNLVQSGQTLVEEHVRKEYDADGRLLDSKAKTYTWILEAKQEQVSVPAGTYTCVRLRRLDQDEGDKTFWYASGVGKVRELDDKNEEQLIEAHLVDQ